MASPHPLSRRGFLGRTVAAGAATLVSPGALVKVAAAETGRAGAWQIGCYTRPWGKCDYREALDAIAEAGYKHAGLMTTKAKNNLVISTATTPEEAGQIAEELKKRGLSVPSVYGGGIPAGESLQAAIDALRTLIDRCATVGSASLLMGGIADEKLYGTYYKAIAECCDYAAEKKMLITVKPHGGLNATGPQCRKCVETVGHKNFRIWYDPGNIYFYSGGALDPVEDAATVDGLVAGMSVKDFQAPKNVAVTPGTGQVRWKELMARLRQGGFTAGPMVVECLAPVEGKALIEEAKKARLFLEELLR